MRPQSHVKLIESIRDALQVLRALGVFEVLGSVFVFFFWLGFCFFFWMGFYFHEFSMFFFFFFSFLSFLWFSIFFVVNLGFWIGFPVHGFIEVRDFGVFLTFLGTFPFFLLRFLGEMFGALSGERGGLWVKTELKYHFREKAALVFLLLDERLLQVTVVLSISKICS